MQMIQTDVLITEIERAIKTKATAEHITAGEAAGLLFSERPALYAAYDRATKQKIKVGDNAPMTHTEEPKRPRTTAALTKLETAAAALQAREPGLSAADAMVKACEADPKAYAEHSRVVARGDIVWE